MRLLKRTYALPPDTVIDFEQAVEPGHRSALIAALLKNWIEERHREQLRREVIEGCQEMSAVYRETEREYHPLEEEIYRGLDQDAQAGRNRKGATGSRKGF